MLTSLMTGAIRFYQHSLGMVKPPCCRYHPTCSEYTRLAIEAHGPGRGLWLGLGRLGRCHPWGGFGYDPVPGSVTLSRRETAPAAATTDGEAAET